MVKLEINNVIKIENLSIRFESIEYRETDFNSVFFPIVRNISAKLLANDLVAVKPMGSPSSNLFYSDYSFISNYNNTFILDSLSDFSIPN